MHQLWPAPCNGACPNLQSDSNNCGHCGTQVSLGNTLFAFIKLIFLQCPTGSSCSSGSCKCTNSGQPPCNGACPNLQSDSNNCGHCGTQVSLGDNLFALIKLTHLQCTSGTSCSSGSCKCTNSGQPQCNGACPTYSSDSSNCGACGNVVRRSRCRAYALTEKSRTTNSI